MAQRDYLYYDTTISLCPLCLRRVNAKIIFQEEKVFLLKHCFEHGSSKTLISTDVAYYKRCRDYLKPGDLPRQTNTRTEWGCPYDCGLCPDHEQHSCVSLIELTDRCNLTCPTCYTVSSPHTGSHRTLEEINRMLDAVVANEGEPDVVQISGGEPTLHPGFFEVLSLARTKPIRHLMINTNGTRLAHEDGFAEKLAAYGPGLEIYLQFDSLQKEALLTLRGADQRETHRKALERLNALNLSTSLVVTLQKGVNSGEIGAILDFALAQRCVRGVTFQPVQVAGRLESFETERDRLVLSEVRREILRQFPLFTEDDLIPVPCHPEAITMGYALKLGGKLYPFSHFMKPEEALLSSGNTISFERDAALREKIIGLFSTGNSPQAASEKIQSILCCLPKIETGPLTYENIFRVLIVQFFDAHNFDVRPVKRSCIHIVTKEGKLVPFDTMNLFYRPAQQALLKQRREEAVARV